jgi:hypothetical protein
MVTSAPTFRADTGTVTGGGVINYSSNPTFDTINSGTNTVSSSYGFSSGATVNSGATVANYTHYLVGDVTGSGSLSTTQIGVDIPSMSKATTNIGLRNASSTVFVQTTTAITTASNTIPNTGTYQRLNNTSGGSVTLGATNPVIAAGQQGQILIICNTSANNVVVPTGGSSGLLLAGAASNTLGVNDTLMLLYSTNLSAWVQIGGSNN